MPNKKAMIIIGIIIVSIAGLGTGGALCVYSTAKEFDEIYMDGIYIEDTHIGGLTKEEAKSQVSKAVKDKEGQKSITFYGEDKKWEIPYTKLQGKYNIDKVLEEAFEIGRTGNTLERFRAFTSKNIEKQQLTLDRVHNPDVAQEIISEYKDEFYIAPKNAIMERREKKFIISPEQAGQKLDIEATAEKLNNMYASNIEGQIEAVIVPVDAQITSSYYDHVQSPIASFYTTFSNADPDRNINLKVGASTINTSVGPGETFALSDHFGNITRENGYKTSKVIVNGKLVEGIGGGICQVASTLYNSVLLTDLKVTSRQNHSLPVGYIPLGRDATYASGAIDFKFENPTEYPAYVESYVEGNRLYVNIFGHESLKPDSEVKFESVVTEVIPAPAPKYENDPNLAKGVEKEDLSAREGKKVNLYKYIYKDGQLVDKVLENKSYYRPRAAIIRVGTKEVPLAPEPEPEVETEPELPEENTPEIINDPSQMSLYEE